MPIIVGKILIALASAFLVILFYMFFDPSLRDFLYAILLYAYLAVLKIIVQFVFKKGIVTFATIAWKKIFFVGGAALFKRFWIDFFKNNAITHVVRPLIPHSKKWISAHMNDFNSQPLWLKFSETAVGIVIIGAIGYFVGFIGYIWTLVEKILTGKFQSFFISILGMLGSLFGFIWSKISPFFDVIIITALINSVTRMPFFKRMFYKTKKVKDKVVEHKDNAIRAVIHKPVSSLAKVIDGHADKKIKMQEKEVG